MAKKSVLTEATDTLVTGAKEVETFARGLATAAIVAAADAVAALSRKQKGQPVNLAQNRPQRSDRWLRRRKRL
jgi:hypothetical protein